MTTAGSMFDLAIDLRDRGSLRDSIEVLTKILADFPDHEKNYVIYTTLSGIYSDLREYDKYLANSKKASELNPKYELASLCLYLAYAKLDRDDEAIKELIRYLTEYPAKLYKDTLEELLEGLEDGFMKKYENQIKDLAQKNGVNIKY